MTSLLLADLAPTRQGPAGNTRKRQSLMRGEGLASPPM